MADKAELERLAAAVNCLRPEWPAKSILTFLAAHHAHRAYSDLASAFALVATDPKTQTPARLSEAGPWWRTTSTSTTPSVGPGREPHCTVPSHEHELARHCRACRADALAGETEETQ
jgi:hypothetical protein